jgi:hypothetical protein
VSRPKRLGVLGHRDRRSGTRPVVISTDRLGRCRCCGGVATALLELSEYLCRRCAAVRAGWENQLMGRFSIADRRGWGGPALVTDEEVRQRIRGSLAKQALASAAENKRETRRARRAARSRVPMSEAKRGLLGTKDPQKPCPRKTDPTPVISPARRVS